MNGVNGVKTRISSIMLMFILCVSTAVLFVLAVPAAPAFAAGNGAADSGEAAMDPAGRSSAAVDGFVSTYSTYPRLMDGADLLTDQEESRLLEKLDEVSERQKFDIVIASTDSLHGDTAQDYADDLYDSCGYGYGAGRDGVLLLVSMEDRDWWISTCGYGITVFTDAGIEYLSEQFLEDLSDGDYASAFQTYVEQCDQFITQAGSGEPYGQSNLPHAPLSPVCILIAFGMGLAIAAITVGVMISKLKTVRSQAAAGSYVKDGSLNITESRDLFLYRNVHRTARPKNNDSGSSTHTSSSGTLHGGGGGKF